MSDITQELTEAILSILGDDTTYPESVVADVLLRLESFNYELDTADAFAIAFAIRKVEQHILNSCNLLKVPEELYTASIERICAEFLSSKLATGSLVIGSLDLSGVVTQLKEGDVTVSFSTADTDEGKLKSLLSAMCNTGEDDLICFRKLRW